jgi:hypothetical protein
MSTVERTTIQVPIDKSVKEAWEEYVARYGFDSVQSYIRFIAKADVDGRKVDLDGGMSLSPEAAARYDKELNQYHSNPEKYGSKGYTDVDELMNDLNS